MGTAMKTRLLPHHLTSNHRQDSVTSSEDDLGGLNGLKCGQSSRTESSNQLDYVNNAGDDVWLPIKTGPLIPSATQTGALSKS